MPDLQCKMQERAWHGTITDGNQGLLEVIDSYLAFRRPNTYEPIGGQNCW